MRLFASRVVVALLLLPRGAGAQQAIEVGVRVRLRIAGERARVVGWVTESGPDSLTLAVDCASRSHRAPCPRGPTGRRARVRVEEVGHSLRIGIDELTEVERSIGTHRNTRGFALAAGLIGGAMGAFAASTCNECYPEWWSLGAVMVGVPSLFLGGIVGTFVVTEDWKDVSGTWSERAAAMLPSALVPARDGGLTVSWTIGVP